MLTGSVPPKEQTAIMARLQAGPDRDGGGSGGGKGKGKGRASRGGGGGWEEENGLEGSTVDGSDGREIKLCYVTVSTSYLFTCLFRFQLVGATAGEQGFFLLCQSTSRSPRR
jgi:hypothetical protein